MNNTSMRVIEFNYLVYNFLVKLQIFTTEKDDCKSCEEIIEESSKDEMFKDGKICWNSARDQTKIFSIFYATQDQNYIYPEMFCIGLR